MDKTILKENRLHGTRLFPVGVYELLCISGDTILDCHWHDECELLLVTEGQAIFQLNDAYHELEAGQAAFIHSGCIHAGYPLHRSSCAYKAIVFDPAFLYSHNCDSLQLSFIDPLLNGQLSFITANDEWEQQIVAHLLSIFRLFAQTPYAYQLKVKALLLLILAELLAHNEFPQIRTPSVQPHQSAQMKIILNYIHTNYHEKISITTLCELVNLSEGHFCRMFKQMMRRTPIEYINYYRIQNAAQLLRQTNRKLLDVALSVGFDNLSYFHSLFKKHLNCTPLEYRRKEQQAFPCST